MITAYEAQRKAAAHTIARIKEAEDPELAPWFLDDAEMYAADR